MSEYQILIGKLDRFIRKFYKNELVKGLLISLIIGILWLVITSASEYFGHFSVPVRTSVFYLSLTAFLGVMYQFVLKPLFGIWRIGRVISHKQAAAIISRHFEDVQDQLLNVLELKEMAEQHFTSTDLLIASIDQKIQKVKPFDFTRAIDFKSNLPYLKRFGTLMLVLLLILLIYPSLLTEGTSRILHHKTAFAPEAPFGFELLNENLNVEKGKDIELKVQVKGRYLPSEAFIEYGGGRFLMKKVSKDRFSYLIRNVNNAFSLFFRADEVVSAPFDLKVLPAPSILDFSLKVKVPAYTGESDKLLKNVGDLTVPYGSICTWEIAGQDVDTIGFVFGDSLKFIAKKEGGKFRLNRSMLRSFEYRIFGFNSFFRKDELLRFQMNVTPDLFPSINVNQAVDSMNPGLYYFRGRITDDYGFSRLALKLKNTGLADSVITLDVNKVLSDQEFAVMYDFTRLGKEPGEKIEYYFEVWDNDGINGAKSSKTAIYEYSIPTRGQLDRIEKDLEKAINDKLESSRKLAERFQKNLKDVRQKAFNEKSSDWENAKKVESLLQMHQQLEQGLKDMLNNNKKLNQIDRSFNEMNQDILDKQKQIEEMMNSLFDEEMKKLMDELRELSKDFDKDKLKDLSEKLDLTYEDLKDQLDKDLELLKRFNVEDQVFKRVEELRDLARQQDRLSEQTKESMKDDAELQKAQEAQQKEFNRIEEEYKKAREENQGLKEPMDLKDFQKEMEQISSDMKEGKEKLSSGDKKGASGKQKKSSDQMEQLADQMEQMMQQRMEEEEEDNSDMLKQILENLVSFSFDQESLIGKVKSRDVKDPQMGLANRMQIGLRDNLSVIRDSLMKLASKTPQIGAAVNKELLSMERNIASSIDKLKDRKGDEAAVNQQLVMTSANNLALLLSEALKQMQQQPQDGQPSSCKSGKKGKKKGQGKPSLSEMRGLQQGMKEQMQRMIDEMKKGQGGGKPDKNAQNKRLAQMLAQQEIFNQMLNEMMMNNGVGSQAQKLLQEIKSLLDQNQRDIVNRNINPETLQRQNLIVTRMLEAENSENQREVDPKRESKEMKDQINRNVKPLDLDAPKRNAYSELLIRSQMSLGNYYRKKYKDYLVKINE